MSDTAMQKGIPTRWDRKIGGRAYLLVHQTGEGDGFDVSRNLHRSISCGQANQAELVKVPYFYEHDGTMKAQYRGEESTVHFCPSCESTRYDLDWQTQAVCQETGMLAWEEPDLFIALNCNDCPVQRECLDQGEVDNVGGMVYGGIHLSQNGPARRAAIKERREQWATQDSQ